VQSVLLHKGGIAVTVPAPERYAVRKLIVSNLRQADSASYAKARKDAVQSGLLIEALTLNSRDADLGFAWMEAWDRGPRWRKHLTAGRKRLSAEQAGLLRSAVSVSSGHEAKSLEAKSLADYGFEAEHKAAPANR
jgi:hypothetical protein